MRESRRACQSPGAAGRFAGRRAPKALRRKPLPAGLFHARDLALIGKLAEADAANAVLAQICMRAAADFAAVISAGAELRRHLLFDLFACLSQISCPPLIRERSAQSL